MLYRESTLSFLFCILASYSTFGTSNPDTLLSNALREGQICKKEKYYKVIDKMVWSFSKLSAMLQLSREGDTVDKRDYKKLKILNNSIAT